MKKKIILLGLTLVFLFSVTSCTGNQDKSSDAPMPERPAAVIDLQHKIDKALESSPTYRDLLDIRDAYNDLLQSEQELVDRYDELEPLFALSSEDVACIYAISNLKSQLKNPSSFTLLSASCAADTDEDTIALKINYTAANNMGGAVEDTYYCLVYTPEFNDDHQQWSCKLEEEFSLTIALEALGGARVNSSEKVAKDVYDSNAVIDIDIDKIMDNLDLQIEAP